MSNEGFDPCQIVRGLWEHEMSMRRLLDVLRNSQSYCTDNECLDVGTSSSTANPDYMLLVVLAMFTAVFLYYFRPGSQTVHGDSKPRNNGNNSDGAPPSSTSN
ncbi:small integral membrane protein 14 [Diabrotica virgifera virgifera]|uniref:Small integral membrane protein 14 n=1 Tax=Diabrotica virgifera virgifera TaxID=50390 RepID=A0A6P7FGZ5_DIAVI|nr:small integral membrane protein 14 [Diabrotica virgifera virgifera]